MIVRAKDFFMCDRYLIIQFIFLFNLSIFFLTLQIIFDCIRKAYTRERDTIRFHQFILVKD